MENNIDDILKDKAFDCMDDKNKQELKELCIKMQGKSVEEALPFLMSYSGRLKNSKCTKSEKQAIIKILLSQLDNERKQIMKFLKIMGKITIIIVKLSKIKRKIHLKLIKLTFKMNFFCKKFKM